MKALILVLWLSMVLVLAMAEENAEEAKKTCAREKRRGLRAIEKTLSACVEEFKTKVSSQGTESSNDCIAKCIMKNENALNEQDLVTEETIEETIGTRATGARREKLTAHFKQCLNQYGKTEQIGNEDASCKGYEALGLCMRAGVMDMCDDGPTTKDEL